MNKEEIENIVEIALNKSNKEFKELKENYDELLADYIELSRVEEEQEKRIDKAIEYLSNTRNITEEEYKEGITLDYDIIKNDLLEILKVSYSNE